MKCSITLAVFIFFGFTSYSQNFGIGTVTPTSTLSVAGSLSLQYTKITSATYSMAATDYYVSWSNAGAGTINLPAAVTGAGNFKGRIYMVKNISAAQTLTLTPAASETIDGAGSLLLKAGDGVTLINTGLTTGISWEVLQFTGTASAASYWSIIGNSGVNAATNFLGTTDARDLVVRTNNIERMRVNSVGNIGIGSTNFDPIDPEKLLIDVGTNPVSHTMLGLKGSIDDYLQMTIQNTSNGSYASSDFVAVADNGDADTNYIDMGINSSNYAPGVENFGGPNDGYLYINGRNLVLGTQNKNDIIFLTGGGSTRFNEGMRLDGNTRNFILGRLENVANAAPVGGTLRATNAGPKSPANSSGGSLSLFGGNAVGTGTGGSINLTGGTSATGTHGEVNINANTNNITNINTGTSNQAINIGSSTNSIFFPKFSSPGTVLYSATVSGQVAATAAGTAGQVLISNGTGAPAWGNGNFWALTGNGSTNSGINFLGTTDLKSLRLRTNNVERMVVDSLGRVGIGTNAPTVTLQVRGTAGLGFAGPSGTTGTLSFYNATNANAVNINAGTTTTAYTLTLPVAAPASNGQVLTGTTAGVLSWTTPTGASGTDWSVAGNTGTNAATDFLGTTDGQGLVFKVNNTQAGYLGLSGSSYATSFGVGASGSSTAFASTALGAGAQATGSNASLAVGYNAKASSQDAIAIGDNAQAKTGNESIAIGFNATAAFTQAIAIGSGAQASSTTANNETIAIGHNANANSYQGIAIGALATTSSNNATLAIGVSAAASGYQSTAIGYNAKATTNNTVIIGDATNATLNTGLGTTTPAAKLDVSGTYKLGTAGTVLTNMIKTTISVNDVTTFNYISTRQVTATVAGANPNAMVILNPRTALPAGIGVGWVRVSAANTLTIGFTNTDTALRALGAAVFDVTIIQ